MTTPFDFIARHMVELERREVLRVAVTYAIVAWLLLQVAEVTFEPSSLGISGDFWHRLRIGHTQV